MNEVLAIMSEHRVDTAILEEHPGLPSLADLIRQVGSLPDIQQIPLVLVSPSGRHLPGIGRTVRLITLFKPLRQPPTARAIVEALTQDTASIQRQPSQEDGLAENPSSVRILLAEDNPVNQHVSLVILRSLGYMADLAANGHEAVQMVTSSAESGHPYRLVLMDAHMPEMDGEEAARLIREQVSQADQPTIIALTANAIEDFRKHYIDAGMDDYLAKPVSKEELAQAIQRNLARAFPSPLFGGNAQPAIQRDIIDEWIQATDRHVFIEILNSFLQNTPDLITQMTASCESSHASQLAVLAQTLANEASNVGAIRLSELAQILEKVVRENANPTTCEKTVRTISVEFNRAVLELNRLRNELGFSSQRNAAINRAALRQYWLQMGADASQMLAQTVAIFREETPGQINNLRLALTSRDLPVALNLAHALKGSCYTVGATGLVESCLSIELACRQNQIQNLDDAMANLEIEYQRVLVELDTISLDDNLTH